MATESNPETKDGLQPGHDIFYTPDNTSFYATKPYSQLNPAEQEVRLLRLLPYSGNGLIECELLEATPLLNVKGRYTALSYCAGSPRETDVILLNGTRFNVFASLGHALKQIRNFWDQKFPDRECIVWIDQICINQNDIGERSHQVRFMREIYEYSEQVIACLSTEDTDPKGMDWLLEITECRGSDPLTILHVPSSKQLGDTRYIEGWASFYDILQAPWWGRAWVFQEFIVAPTLYIMYGARFASWENFSFAFISVNIAWSIISTLGKGFYSKRLSKLEESNHDLVVQRIRDGESNAVSKIEFMVKKRDTWCGSIDLKELLNHSRYCESSDPRDKVFAFLGLAKFHYGILPDYSQTLAQVLTEMTMKIIQYEDSLDIVCIAASSSPRSRTNGLESWAVDWTCDEEPPENTTRDFTTKHALRSNGLNRTNPNASFHCLKTQFGHLIALKLRGVLIDVINIKRTSVGFSLGFSDVYSDLWHSEKGYLINASDSCQSGDQVWILDGAGLPLILRPQGDSRCSLISVTSIYSITSISDHGLLKKDGLQKLLKIALNDQGGWQTVFII